jgi:hypothetical protein
MKVVSKQRSSSGSRDGPVGKAAAADGAPW